MSRTKHDWALSCVTQASHPLEDLLINYDFFINRDKCLLHYLSEVAEYGVIVVTHYALDHFISLLEDLLVYLVLIGQKLIVMLVLFSPFSHNLGNNVSDIVRVENQTLQFLCAPHLHWFATRVERDKILSMFVRH